MNSIGGVRVNSRRVSVPVSRYQPVINSKATKSTRLLAQHIPFWPEIIKISDLCQKIGLTKNQVEARVSSCHGDYLIFSISNGALSRLKDDLSNV